MAGDKPQLDPGILERLYPDELEELSEAERQTLLDGPASDRDIRDREAFGEMLQLIRAEEFGEDVPESVHTSIMDAARAHHAAPASAPTESRAEATAARAPRVPPADHPHRDDSKKPLRARIPVETGRQIALVATILLVAGVAFILTRAQRDAPTHHIADSVISSPRESDPKPKVAAKAESQTQSPESDDDKGAERDEAAEENNESELALNTPREPDAQATPLRTPAHAERRGRSIESESRSRKEDRAAPRKSRATRPAPRAKRALKKASPRSQSAIDLWDSDSPSESISAFSAKSTEAEAPALDDAEPSAQIDAIAESKSKEAAEEESRPDTSKIDAIAESFASAHYDETATRVDAFLGEPSASAADKARALEFKARAQERSGDPSGALDTYQQLQKQHADFKSSAVAAAIARLEAALNENPKRSEPLNNKMAPRPSSIDINPNSAQ